MARLRRDTHDMTPTHPPTKPLRIVASGTLFLTYTLSIPTQPAPSSVVRAHSVEKRRGGSANTLLALLAQFPSVEAVLIAPLSGSQDGQMILRDLAKEGVVTRFCKIWKEAGVPSAWVLSAEDSTRTVVNHNPLPDITHEEFVSLLGPLLAPENYPQTTPATPTSASNLSSSTYTTSSISRPSQSGPSPNPFLSNPNSPAPFDWLHFEGRTVKTTLAYWGKDGAAVLSLPTKEYFQSSGWVEEPSETTSSELDVNRGLKSPTEQLSVRSGSDFWAAARSQTPSSSDFFSAGYMSDLGNESGASYSTSSSAPKRSDHQRGERDRSTEDDDDNDSQCTEMPGDDRDHDGIVDDVGGQDAFVAGMIYALSRRIAPGLPYTPAWAGEDSNITIPETDRGRWRLDECLRWVYFTA
ncbi:hypothetical protein H0H93_000990 [Arthromyces matolae]|nr:hypothetical protein H0H93_000990 [Arthromyces matolae]